MEHARTIGTILLAILLAGSAGAIIAGHLSNAVTASVTVLPGEPDVPEVTTDCFDDGWKELTRLDGSSFENPGRCVSYVATKWCIDSGWEYLTRTDGSAFNSQGQCVSYFSTFE